VKEQILEEIIAVLKFYSKTTKYQWDTAHESLVEPEILYDSGRRARELLQKIKEQRDVFTTSE
jgi:hypothetical protein